MTDAAAEMRLYDDLGQRLYLDAGERERFLVAANEQDRETRVFCHLLHFTGCRPTEALQLVPRRVSIAQNEIVLRSLKKKRLDKKGKVKKPAYRAVPVPERLISDIDLVFDLRQRQKLKPLIDSPLWSWDRTTAWRRVKKVMAIAKIEGPQATPKGLRHGFAIALVLGEVPLTMVRDMLGHTDIKTTEIYLQALGTEKRAMVMRAWQ